MIKKEFIDFAIQCNNKTISLEDFKEKVGMDFNYFWLLNKKACLKAWREFIDSKKPSKKIKLFKVPIKGVRCEFSELGIKECSFRQKQRHGVIVGESRDGQSYRVIWDGVYYAWNYYKGFIKTLPPLLRGE